MKEIEKKDIWKERQTVQFHSGNREFEFPMGFLMSHLLQSHVAGVKGSA